MRKFDTKVQYLKYKVLREVAREAWNDTLLEHLVDIPKKIVPGNTPTMRCCVYKERAILAERVKLAMGGCKENHNVIEVIDTACDECPMGGYEVTNACRGCSLTAARMSAREALSPLTTIMSPILTNPSASAAECVPRSALTPPLSAVNVRVRTLARSKLSQ